MAMTSGKRPILAGVILIVAGLLLLTLSARATRQSKHVRDMLEGQGIILVPAGVAALAYGATVHTTTRAKRRPPSHRKKPSAPHQNGEG